MLSSQFGPCAAPSIPSWWGTHGWGSPGGQFITFWGVTVAKSNRLFSFITGYWMFSTIAISYIISKFATFFLPGLAIGHSHVTSVQHKLLTPVSISPAPPATSPSLDASGGTDLRCLMHRIVRHCGCFW